VTNTSRKELSRKERKLANGVAKRRDSSSWMANPKETLQTVQDPPIRLSRAQIREVLNIFQPDLHSFYRGSDIP
jgi:hypothetical protein